MLKKRAVRVLLPLLFSFCFVFSGFLSVNVFAINSIPGTYVNSWMLTSFKGGTRELYFSLNTENSTIWSGVAPWDSASQKFFYDNPSSEDVTRLYIGRGADGFNFEFIPEIYDYYIVLRVMSNIVSDPSDFTFFPENGFIRGYDISGSSTGNKYFTDISVLPYSDTNQSGFQFVGKIPVIDSAQLNVICLRNGVDGVYTGSIPADLELEGLILAYEKSEQSQTQSIVAAINNQTNQLGSDIGQAADDVQQSIEDQYSGDPKTEFSVDDVIMQHNEKMGVLSFGSDVMLQFLDMFQSANVGTAQLTLPGFNITVENVEYSVWPDYSFNFEQLNEWVPALMSVIRVMMPAFVWLMVLRYCIKVFEDNFLAK